MKMKLAIGLFAMMFAVSGIAFAADGGGKNRTSEFTTLSDANCVLRVPKEIDEESCELAEADAISGFVTYFCSTKAICMNEE